MDTLEEIEEKQIDRIHSRDFSAREFLKAWQLLHKRWIKYS
jgi:hypothetical protein